MRRTNYIFTIATIFMMMFTFFAQAQVPGYQGKRFIVKLDPLSPLSQKGIVAGVEYVVTRRIAFGATYQRSNKSYTQRISEYKQAWGVFPDEKGKILDNQFGVEIQYYPNKSVPAPQGSYIFANYFQGLAHAKGDIYDPRFSEHLTPYTIKNIRSSLFTIGLGNKAIAYKILVLEFDFGISMGNLNVPSEVGDATKMSFQSFTDQYGPNIYSFGELTGNGGLGLSGHVKVGFLLF